MQHLDANLDSDPRISLKTKISANYVAHGGFGLHRIWKKRMNRYNLKIQSIHVLGIKQIGIALPNT